VTRFRHDRKGPPTVGRGLGGHPVGFERPSVYVSDEERKRRRKVLAAERTEQTRIRLERERASGTLEEVVEARLLQLLESGTPLNEHEINFLAERASWGRR